MSIVVPLPTSNYSREIDYLYKEDEGDLCISIESFHGSESLRSSMQKEKQISVDPISLKQSMKYEGPPPLLPPIDASFTDLPIYPPPLPPSKQKFVSASLPGSTTASPRSAGQPQTKSVKKWRNQAQASQINNPLHRQHTLGPSRFAVESHLFRSKSCGEGRAYAPSDEFDLFSRKLTSPNHEIEDRDDNGNPEYKRIDVRGKKIKDVNPDKYMDDDFKCGACLFLPAFGKGKPVRARKDEGEPAVVVAERNVISRTVSLEKFECGSWSSSALLNDDDGDRESMHHLYFDLPLELIKNCGNDDANSPVTTAFVFDSDGSGALKKSSSRTAPRKPPPHESSSRHVRISTTGSPGSCITPRLRKERDDFNAFLQAQNA